MPPIDHNLFNSYNIPSLAVQNAFTFNNNCNAPSISPIINTASLTALIHFGNFFGKQAVYFTALSAGTDTSGLHLHLHLLQNHPQPQLLRIHNQLRLSHLRRRTNSHRFHSGPVNRLNPGLCILHADALLRL